jgi:hypothetical protein
LCGSCIGLLLIGGDVARAAFAESASLQNVIEIAKRLQRYPRSADLHPGAGQSVEHPRRDHGHDAGKNLDMDKRSRLPAVHTLDPDLPTEQGMPAVPDDDKLPDMGRMDRRWR